MLEEFQAAAKMPIQTRHQSISPFGSIFRFDFLLLLYFGWCRPGRHYCVVVGDIAPELCTGRSRQIRSLLLNTHPCCEGQVTFSIRVKRPFAQNAVRHPKIVQSHKSHNNTPKFQLFSGSDPEFP